MPSTCRNIIFGLVLLALTGPLRGQGGWTDGDGVVRLTNSTDIVSIGTTSLPYGYKPAVDGKIICEEVKVKDSGSWPDFVFLAGYDLMPLPDVERYIAEHQHLPGVPSAEEVAADGQSLGETQALLLQKIEELTLYVIEMDRENQVLKTRVANLENRRGLPE